MMKTFILFLLACVPGLFQVNAQNITLEFSNPVVIGVDPNAKLQFDVLMTTNTAGLYHSRGQLFINYNSNAFGAQVFTNGKITYELLGLLNEEFAPTFPKYTVIGFTDSGNDKFAFTWQSSFLTLPPGPTFHTLIPQNSPTPLVRFTIDIADPMELAGIEMDQVLTSGQMAYFTGSTPTEALIPGPYTYTNNFLTLPLDGTAFPVEWLSFDARAQSDDEILLTWATGSEINNDYFEIERSEDGAKFVSIGSIPGAGNTHSPTSYQFSDRNAASGRWFYRIKQVDKNGGASFSNVVEVDVSEALRHLYLYPNPVRDILTIESSRQGVGLGNIQIADLAGRVVYHQSASEATQTRMLVQTDHFVEGLYLLQVEFTDGSEAQSMLKVGL